MTGEGAEQRLKRLSMRSWRRGTKEMDMILGPFSDAFLGSLSPSQLDAYDAVLEENDQDLYQWVSGQAEAPDQHRLMVNLVRGYLAKRT